METRFLLANPVRRGGDGPGLHVSPPDVCLRPDHRLPVPPPPPVLVFDPDGKDRRVFASGLRNCVGLAVHPRTGEPICVKRTPRP